MLISYTEKVDSSFIWDRFPELGKVHHNEERTAVFSRRMTEDSIVFINTFSFKKNFLTRQERGSSKLRLLNATKFQR